MRAQGTTINFLVNDAGLGVYGNFAETDLERELAIIRLNVLSLVVLTKLFLRDMLARNEGRILQLGSMVSKNPAPWSRFTTAPRPSFVYNFSQSLIQEIEGSNVSLTVLRPGATDTDFFRKEDGEQMTAVQDGKLGPPDKVAQDRYAALMRGKDAVVSGIQNKVMDKLSQMMPGPRRSQADEQDA